MNRRGRLEWWQDPPTDAELAADNFNPADFDPDFDYKPEEDDVPLCECAEPPRSADVLPASYGWQCGRCHRHVTEDRLASWQEDEQ